MSLVNNTVCGVRPAQGDNSVNTGHQCCLRGPGSVLRDRLRAAPLHLLRTAPSTVSARLPSIVSVRLPSTVSARLPPPSPHGSPPPSPHGSPHLLCTAPLHRLRTAPSTVSARLPSTVSARLPPPSPHGSLHCLCTAPLHRLRTAPLHRPPSFSIVPSHRCAVSDGSTFLHVLHVSISVS